MNDERYACDGHMRFYDGEILLNVNVVVDRLNDYDKRLKNRILYDKTPEHQTPENIKRLKKIMEINKERAQYTLKDNVITTDTDIWDLNNQDDVESLVNELECLRRKSLNMFALTTILYDNNLSNDEFYKALKMIQEE